MHVTKQALELLDQLRAMAEHGHCVGTACSDDRGAPPASEQVKMVIPPPPPPAWVQARKVRLLLKLRHRRISLFEGADLFADPAWDIMLDLYAADLERKDVSVSSACIAAMVPPTTALRWLTYLASEGLVDRCEDPLDRRRAYVFITEKAKSKVRAFMEIFDDILEEIYDLRAHTE